MSDHQVSSPFRYVLELEKLATPKRKYVIFAAVFLYRTESAALLCVHRNSIVQTAASHILTSIACNYVRALELTMTAELTREIFTANFEKGFCTTTNVKHSSLIRNSDVGI